MASVYDTNICTFRLYNHMCLFSSIPKIKWTDASTARWHRYFFLISVVSIQSTFLCAFVKDYNFVLEMETWPPFCIIVLPFIVVCKAWRKNPRAYTNFQYGLSKRNVLQLIVCIQLEICEKQYTWHLLKVNCL